MDKIFKDWKIAKGIQLRSYNNYCCCYHYNFTQGKTTEPLLRTMGFCDIQPGAAASPFPPPSRSLFMEFFQDRKRQVVSTDCLSARGVNLIWWKNPYIGALFNTKESWWQTISEG